MAFYKPMQLKKNGKWYPQAVQVDKPFETDELADRLAQISTVSRADVYAVLVNLPAVMADMMNAGRSVRMEGLGTFRYTIHAAENGVDTSADVSADQIRSVRVRYTPETRRPNKTGDVTRALVPDTLRWVRFDGTPAEEDDTEEPGGDGGDDSGEDGGL